MSHEEVASEAAQESIVVSEWMTEKMARADKEVRAFLTEHPLLSLACAVGAGYLLARLLRGRR
jgi:hypothetical protein